MKRGLLVVCALAAATAIAGAATASTNLLPNGGFEQPSNLSGWSGYNATLSLLTSGAAVGTQAARVTWSGSGTSFSIVPSPKPVSSTVAGRVYSGDAYFKSTRPGKTVCLRIRETTSSGSFIGASLRCLTTTSAWQTFGTLEYTARGGGVLDIYVYQSTSPSSGDVFDVDGFLLTDGTPPSDTTPPETTIDSGPSGTTTETTATFTFSANEPATFQCSLDNAPWSACSSPRTYSGLAAGTHTFRVRAIDTAGNVDPTPAERTWTIQQASDTTPPETTIDSGPSGTTTDTTATFTFSANEPATFECSLNGSAWTACTSPRTYTGLAVGTHTFGVRAIDTAGNVDPTPAERTWTIASASQTNFVTNGSFEQNLNGWSGFNASLSRVTGGADGTWAARVTRTSGSSFSIFPSPRHVLDSRAGMTYVGDAWVRSLTPGNTACLRIREWQSGVQVAITQECVTATSSWQRFPTVRHTAGANGRQIELSATYSRSGSASFDVDGFVLVDGTAPPPPPDTTPPETTIDSGPSGTTTERNATFTFSANEPATFQCSLNGSAWAACTSPRTYTNLTVGTHTFRVRATDTAGNVDPTPAERTWTITAHDTTPPETTITGGPSGTVRRPAPTFTFTANEPATFECSFDGQSWWECTSGGAIVAHAGNRTLHVRAIDSAGNVDPTPATRSWWADPLLQNGNGEMPVAGWARQGTYQVAGWRGHQGNVSLVPGVRGQGFRVAYASGDSYSLYSSPKPVNATVAGRTYTASGWVRGLQGKTICLRLREFAPSGIVGGGQSCVTPGAVWTQFPTVSYAASASGNELEVLVYQSTAPSSGDWFETDELWLDDGTPNPAPLGSEGPDPVLLAVSDVASCWSAGDEAVARLLDSHPGTISIAGDTEQNFGSDEEYRDCYDPAWGRHKARTRPVIGDHEFRTPGGAGFFNYFGDDVFGERGKGWYAYTLGTWRIVNVNSYFCANVGCGPGTEQWEWLVAELRANSRDCMAVAMHHPRYSSGSLHGDQRFVTHVWELLHRYRVDFVYSGNDHTYQSWKRQDAHGNLDPTGIRQFVVGTGGTQHYPIGALRPNQEAHSTGVFGVTRFVLRDGSFSWTFLPQEGKSFTHSGSDTCTPLPTDTTPPTVALTAPAEGQHLRGDVAVRANATDDFGIARVEFYAGGTRIGTATSAPYSITWNTRTVPDGEYAITARAIDDAGNEGTSAPRTVRVVNDEPMDETPPETTIVSGPSGIVGTTTAVFEFTSNEAGSTFECRLDGSAWQPCTSPRTYTSLAEGEHTFEVRATDPAGNVDPTPAARTWTIQVENLMPNGSFEAPANLDGWRGHNATLSIVAGVVGEQAARVSANANVTSFSIFRSPRPITNPVAGTVFRTTAWVRSETPGRNTCIRFREYDASNVLIGAAHRCLTATSEWQRFTPVEYTSRGGATLEVYLYMDGAQPGDSFDVDGITLTG